MNADVPARINAFTPFMPFRNELKEKGFTNVKLTWAAYSGFSIGQFQAVFLNREQNCG